jgi:hypothetical protein
MKDEFLEIVDNLNSELYDKYEEETHFFSYRTNGHHDMILFDEEIIWTDDWDDREFNEETDNYEPLEPYIKKLFNEYIEKISRLKL